MKRHFQAVFSVLFAVLPLMDSEAQEQEPFWKRNPLSTCAPCQPSRAVEQRMITTSVLNVREQPGVDARIFGEVHYQNVVTVLDRTSIRVLMQVSDQSWYEDQTWIRVEPWGALRGGWIDAAYTIPVQLPVRRRYRFRDDDERDLFYRTVTAESRGEPYDGKVAVAAVILNRALSGEFPNTLSAVMKQSGQFQPVFQGTIWNLDISREARNACEEALNGRDPSGGALYFFNPHITNPDPRWSKVKERTVEIGDHWFYRNHQRKVEPLPYRCLVE